MNPHYPHLLAPLDLGFVQPIPVSEGTFGAMFYAITGVFTAQSRPHGLDAHRTRRRPEKIHAP